MDSLKIQLQRTVAEKPRYNPLRTSLLGRDGMHAESYSSMKQKQQQKNQPKNNHAIILFNFLFASNVIFLKQIGQNWTNLSKNTNLSKIDKIVKN